MKISIRQLRKIVENTLVNEEDFFGYQNAPGLSGTTEFGMSDQPPPRSKAQTSYTKWHLVRPEETGTQAASKPINHAVQGGETLSTIAKKYKTSVDSLAKINSISNPNKIQKGSNLKIPPQQKKQEDSNVKKASLAFKKAVNAAHPSGMQHDRIPDDMELSAIAAILSQVNKKFGVKLSIGGKAMEPTMIEKLDALVKKVDQALAQTQDTMNSQSDIRSLGGIHESNRRLRRKNMKISRRQLRKIIVEN